MTIANQGLTEKDAWAGARIYSASYLKIYDWAVHSIASPMLWRCPPEPMLTQYNELVSDNHLDVGVGTGYMLDRCRFPSASPRLYLLDLAPAPLEVSKKRLQRYRPQTIRHNLFMPLDFAGEPFDSIGLNFLLHCLPGTMAQKAVVFDNLSKVLNPGGVIFGSTLLGEDVEFTRAARFFLLRFNKVKVFSNLADSRAGLQRVLAERFDEVQIRMEGSVALFSARKRSV